MTAGVFALAPGGDENIVASFAGGATGTTCNTGLNLGRDGDFYGTCSGDIPPFDSGTVFSIPAKGSVKTLHGFDGTDGETPEPGRPVQGTDGNFYGMTEEGGANGHGTAYSMTSDGHLTTLHDFGGAGTVDGSDPSGSLTLASDGNFYGTTIGGGTLGGGTVFKMTPAGTVTVLHNFPGTGKKEGRQPMGGVVQGNDGKFYGVTFGGGVENLGTVYVLKQDGSTKTLHSFSAAESLAFPCDGLALSTDRTMFGIAAACQDGKCAIRYLRSDVKRQFKSLHTFSPSTDGTMRRRVVPRHEWHFIRVDGDWRTGWRRDCLQPRYGHRAFRARVAGIRRRRRYHSGLRTGVHPERD
ncbi:MAG: choice-of-anchor tandem repeat GloVer-containing protein [Rhizomicrobium sp.]